MGFAARVTPEMQQISIGKHLYRIVERGTGSRRIIWLSSEGEVELALSNTCIFQRKGWTLYILSQRHEVFDVNIPIASHTEGIEFMSELQLEIQIR